MSVAHTAAAPERRAPAGTRVFNKVTMLLAGSRVFPLYGVLVHRGRRSGKAYRTPVVVKRTEDGFVVPMPWGLGTDWYRNVSAAGECTVHWKGRDYALVQPEVVDADAAAAYFGGFQFSMMKRYGIAQCLRLRDRQAPHGD